MTRRDSRGGLRRYAAGGKAVNFPWTAPQAQKDPTLPNGSNPVDTPGRVGAPLSQPWYETYGAGPEHLFLGERAIPAVGSFVHDQAAPPSSPGSYGGDYLSLLGMGAVIGKDLWDWYQNRPGATIDPELAQQIESGAMDTSALNQYILNDLTSRGERMPMPFMYDDGTVGYIGGDARFWDSDFWDQMDAGASDTSDIAKWNEEQLNRYGQEMDMPSLNIDPTLWDRAEQGVGGALDIYGGYQQGGAQGLGSMVEGAGDLYQAFGGKEAYGEIAGNVGGILQGIGDGTVQGYLQAGGDAVELARAMGYSGPVLDSAGNLLPVVGQLFAAYEGIQRGDPTGYLQAAGAAASAYGTAAGATLGGAASALPLAAIGFAVADASNYALDHNDRREALFAQRAGLQEVRRPSQGRMPGATYYLLPNGKVLAQQEMSHLHRLSQDASRYGEPYKTRYEETLAQWMADDWHSARIRDMDREWLEEQGYTLAKGGLARYNEGGMVPRRGGLSMAVTPTPRAPTDTSTYYRYGVDSPAPMPQPPPQMPAPRPMPPPMGRAMGGLAMYGYSSGGPQRLVRGPGTGRSDDIPAVLSDGEYVMDAETVALLGDGSTDEGARRLDQLRKKLRMQKGKQLARGSFSSAAKNPEEYL